MSLKYCCERNDPSSPEYYRGVKIRYTLHAREEAMKENIGLFRELPADDLRLVDVDYDDNKVTSVTFKVLGSLGKYGNFFVTIDPSVYTVITVWEVDPRLYRRWQKGKAALRRERGRGSRIGWSHPMPRDSYGVCELLDKLRRGEYVQADSDMLDPMRDSLDDSVGGKRPKRRKKKGHVYQT